MNSRPFERTPISFARVAKRYTVSSKSFGPSSSLGNRSSAAGRSKRFASSSRPLAPIEFNIYS